MRINFWAGAGAGKSTVSANIYYHLRKKGLSVELTREYIKKWAYLGRKPKSFDAVYVFGHQLHSEDLVLQSGVQHIVTDSPLLMQICYCQKYGCLFWKSLLEIANEFEKQYPSLNIFLDRNGICYEENGRYEKENEALEMDKMIFEFANSNTSNLVTIKTIDTDKILEYIESAL